MGDLGRKKMLRVNFQQTSEDVAVVSWSVFAIYIWLTVNVCHLDLLSWFWCCICCGRINLSRNCKDFFHLTSVNDSFDDKWVATTRRDKTLIQPMECTARASCMKVLMPWFFLPFLKSGRPAAQTRSLHCFHFHGAFLVLVATDDGTMLHCFLPPGSLSTLVFGRLLADWSHVYLAPPGLCFVGHIDDDGDFELRYDAEVVHLQLAGYHTKWCLDANWALLLWCISPAYLCIPWWSMLPLIWAVSKEQSCS